MKKIILLAVGAFLFACGDNGSSETISATRDMKIITDAKKGFSKDSIIYLADSAKLVDKLSQFAEFSQQEDLTNLHYVAKSMTSAIYVAVSVQPNFGGGAVSIGCHPNQKEGISFEEPSFPATNPDGYTLKLLDTLKAGDSTYYDVLKFDASEAAYNYCNISAFYYGIHDGLIKVVSRNGIEMNRVPASVYEEAENRRAKERAYADSVAQAVADSIIKANIAALNDSSDTSDTTTIEIPQEVIDLAESVADCIKNAYSSGSLSAVKDCKI